MVTTIMNAQQLELPSHGGWKEREGKGRKGEGREGKERGGKGRGKERKEEKGISGATSSGKEDHQRRVRQCHESECD